MPVPPHRYWAACLVPVMDGWPRSRGVQDLGIRHLSLLRCTFNHSVEAMVTSTGLSRGLVIGQQLNPPMIPSVLL